MKIKCFAIFASLTAIILFFTACKNGGIDEMNKSVEFVKGFIADDSKPLSTIITKEYSLHELKSFFGEVSSNERSAFGENNNETDLSINSVNKKFPIECLRKNGYSVYKVSDGGFFYVFWAKSFNPFSNSKPDDATVYFTAHISSLKKAGDFDSIQERFSTAEDVAKIDPAFELTFLLSGKTPSYSLLDDGTVMEICYSWNDSLASRSDLLVESKEIISKEKCPSKLASVLSIDLP